MKESINVMNMHSPLSKKDRSNISFNLGNSWFYMEILQ
jgi:hypothetical protein